MRRKKVLVENVKVSGYAAEGRSLVKLDGKVIFVENAVPGDVVDLYLTKNKETWAEGKPFNFRVYSKERVQPFCKHFGICGGCKWQMLPYEKQLEYKQQEAIENIKRIGKANIEEILPITGSDAIIHYRNKMEFTFSSKRFLTAEEMNAVTPENNIQHPAVGLHVPKIFDKVIDIEECFLMDDVNNQIRNHLRSFALENGFTFYDIKQHTGWLRNVIIRFCSTGELMVNIVLGYEDEEQRNKLCDYLLQQVPSITTLLYTINTKWNDSIFDLSPQTYYGKGFVIEQLGAYKFKIGPKSFFQTNTKQAEKLYNIVNDFAALTGNETVYDLYCGTGSIGIYVSKNAKKIIGVETIAEAIEDAKENALLNNITHADFFAGDVINICNDEFFAMHGKPDVVITDPPRAGMHEKLVHKLLQIAAPTIVYVSCNTATQARDIALLSEKYSVEKIQPADLFPHTHHIECVALLKLK
ncbi:23S rRNA (uracil(1939)-C(5))-methyltransferase RlmD [Ferruginibacter albus]|uniref:23S rRNA (uracil(1939)-C(5))-methyltransferase RlmD n=1 Tax=Ferruginibacter albus TaxID=2875540 RepID=UPI001CC6205D|nr:23S rRNA (uracil(1939)-C(5))-methyltransferase RlmD [Ferruginibacter albus]UAY51989.1 23S rRNA (uracil(1939)-C(5))-methyltransferase RlmD [Ferruginibacter albus]